mmetsp:Transcript_25411/g.29431  ORF Transcript_25411/g.29431 Transcript_25411/m.29431 type:complete len:197 (+) Transcript_25411:232-822(+)
MNMEGENEIAASDNDMDEMMDIEFPMSFHHVENGGDDDDDNAAHQQDLENSNVTSIDKKTVLKAPIVDIHKHGWDDDAIVRCFDLSISYHDYDETESGRTFKTNDFLFHPKPNTKLDSNGNIVRKVCEPQNSNGDCDLEMITGTGSQEQESKVEKDCEKSHEESTETILDWEPNELLKPHWAADPSYSIQQNKSLS